MSVETTGDGLCTADHQHAYRDVAEWAGSGEQLRQLYVRRGGHCSFTPAEVLVARNRLEQRIEQPSWPSLDPEDLNAAAGELGPELNRLSPTVGALDLDRSGVETSSQFCEYSPHPFTRPYDSRHMT